MKCITDNNKQQQTNILYDILLMLMYIIFIVDTLLLLTYITNYFITQIKIKTQIINMQISDSLLFSNQKIPFHKNLLKIYFSNTQSLCVLTTHRR